MALGTVFHVLHMSLIGARSYRRSRNTQEGLKVVQCPRSVKTCFYSGCRTKSNMAKISLPMQDICDYLRHEAIDKVAMFNVCWNIQKHTLSQKGSRRVIAMKKWQRCRNIRSIQSQSTNCWIETVGVNEKGYDASHGKDMTRVNFQDGWHFRNYFWYNGRMAFESSVCQLHMSIELSSLLAGHRSHYPRFRDYP